MMENIKTELFDLAALIKHGELNIRRVASVTKSMSVGEYFGMLAELISCEPVFTGDLLRLISRDGDRNSFKRVTDLNTLLRNLGYEKHAIDFDGLLDAYDRGYYRQTSTYANRIINDFEGLCQRINAVRVDEPPESWPGGLSSMLLKDWIEQAKEDESRHKPIIMAVDDSPVILKAVISALGDEYKVYTLGKPVMLEKTLSQIRPDLFLLDYNMPDIDGFELISIIRSYNGHEATPIVLLTSEGTADVLTAAVCHGVCDFVVKPLQPEILRNKIARHINRMDEEKSA